MENDRRSAARTKLEDAVWQALEAGLSAEEVREEVDSAIVNA